MFKAAKNILQEIQEQMIELRSYNDMKISYKIDSLGIDNKI